MSFVRFKKETQLEEPQAQSIKPSKSSGLSMKIDVVPIPVSTEEVDVSLRNKQNQSIQKIQTQGKDLFMSNQTVVTQTAGTRLYQTADLYGQVLAVEDLIPMLTSADLTLRLSATREGSHAHGTCMELKTGILANLLDETPDSKNEKITEVSVPANDEKGRMFVGVKLSNGKHYIQKVDYEIASAVDDQLHLKA